MKIKLIKRSVVQSCFSLLANALVATVKFDTTKILEINGKNGASEKPDANPNVTSHISIEPNDTPVDSKKIFKLPNSPDKTQFPVIKSSLVFSSEYAIDEIEPQSINQSSTGLSKNNDTKNSQNNVSCPALQFMSDNLLKLETSNAYDITRDSNSPVTTISVLDRYNYDLFFPTHDLVTEEVTTLISKKVKYFIEQVFDRAKKSNLVDEISLFNNSKFIFKLPKNLINTENTDSNYKLNNIIAVPSTMIIARSYSSSFDRRKLNFKLKKLRRTHSLSSPDVAMYALLNDDYKKSFKSSAKQFKIACSIVLLLSAIVSAIMINYYLDETFIESICTIFKSLVFILSIFFIYMGYLFVVYLLPLS